MTAAWSPRCPTGGPGRGEVAHPLPLHMFAQPPACHPGPWASSNPRTTGPPHLAPDTHGAAPPAPQPLLGPPPSCWTTESCGSPAGHPLPAAEEGGCPSTPVPLANGTGTDVIVSSGSGQRQGYGGVRGGSPLRLDWGKACGVWGETRAPRGPPADRTLGRRPHHPEALTSVLPGGPRAGAPGSLRGETARQTWGWLGRGSSCGARPDPRLSAARAGPSVCLSFCVLSSPAPAHHLDAWLWSPGGSH